MTNTPTGTVTFLFTDIEGSTRMWENHPLQMEVALQRHDDILKDALEAHGGYVFKTVGDAFCAAFTTARSSLEAALAAQRALFAEQWDRNTPIRVRMALHTGAAAEKGGDYFGPAVNRVARLLSAGHGGQVLLSAVTYGLVRDDLGHMEPGSDLRDLGEHRLRDLKHTERIFQLVVPDLPADFPTLRTHGLVGEHTTDERPPEPVTSAAPPANGPAPSEASIPPSGGERYRRVSPLGSGGMAEVYLAHDDLLDRDVALKVLRRQYADDPRFVERFMREARNAASLSHPNIVAVYDRGRTEDGEYYIVMEYVEGGTLKDLIEREGSLPPGRAAGIAAQIARALEAAHARGIVHRDIKPQNVMMGRSGEAKVSDFGIAHAAALTRVTQEGSVLGSAHYVSPEQAMGGEVSPRSDLYSLGVTLYEMLAGEVPHDADTPLGIVMQHVSGQPRAPKEVNPSIPHGLNALVMRLLAKDPAGRYPSAAALADDLERASWSDAPANIARQATDPTQEAIPVREESTRERSRRGSPPHNRKVFLLAGAVGVLLVLLLSGVAMALASFGPGTGLLGQSERQPADEDPPAGSPDGGEDTTVREKEPEDTTSSSPPSGKRFDPEEPADREEEVRVAAEDYYRAAGVEDWGYTYEHLDSETRSAFSREEWFEKNQWLADNGQVIYHILSAELDGSYQETLAEVAVRLTGEDGSSSIRNTYFVYEEGEWLHRFAQEETDLFMPGSSFEEFVAANGGVSSGDEAPDEEDAAVENAVRGHYEAIGDGDFEMAYSYFATSTAPEREAWISGEEESEITDSTINSLEVDEVSGETATATVDVSFEDETGTPRFLITWSLINEDGGWKLERQISAERLE